MSYQSLYKCFVTMDSSEFNKVYLNRFESEASIHFPFEISGNKAFMFFHNDINILLSKIKDYNFKVNELIDNLPQIAQTQYIKKSLIDEILFSNEIEGVVSTRKDIITILDDLKSKNRCKDRFYGIINKYAMLIDSDNLTLNSSADVRKLYDEFISREISNEDKNNLPDGKIFRKDRVHVYNKNGFKVIHEGIYPEDKIIELMDQSIKILNDESIDIFIRVAIFHYLFAYIHPFYDGNGRINRFISSYYLSKMTTPVLKYRLSMSIKENLTEYLDAFKFTNDVRNKGDLSTFVYEFLNIILKSYQKTEMYALGKLDDYTHYKKLIDDSNYSNNEKKLLILLIQSELFSDIGLTRLQMEKYLNVSIATINNLLKYFKELDILKVFKNGKLNYYSVDLEKLTINSK